MVITSINLTMATEPMFATGQVWIKATPHTAAILRDNFLDSSMVVSQPPA
jgi:hypothetical protein